MRDRRAGLVWEARVLAGLAQAYLGRGDAARALATAEEAVAVAQRQGARTFECDAQVALARVLLRSQGAKGKREIEAALARALSLVEETGARVHEPFIRVELAELARLTGDEATRQRELREAHRLFTEMGAPLQAAKLAPLLAEPEG
jgi:thioesterase domain-containing protein